ncbi:NADH:ubiquinone oxidoreductase subunit A [Candidatus Methylospira mobilis]|uniref:NADH-quinone oxidoreductase subunit A n=1 Tax=Candidatus Methylospira mobilis TaxID=1808979 RepID=A0A5Q0BIE1_9GAMM|nr:NADH-quinone oxidoreductase subunit A [Candidatus Methylospira mobilis]QFY41927.1 NADH:ubiquinone oxidoreductase subunit A [Candidatus Methylospira mobilis]WNV02915.1 NADH-quinone oxidoreductase subunit A [Candidatus Methylospira mobilis]
MNPDVVSSPELWPLVAYFLAVLVIVAFMMGASHLLGERSRNPSPATLEPFESGIVPTGTSLLRFSVQFYLVAIFFVIFDIEAVFIFAWAIAFRESGWAGYIEILIFIAVLVATLAYLWLIGALDWRTERQKSIARDFA